MAYNKAKYLLLKTWSNSSIPKETKRAILSEYQQKSPSFSLGAENEKEVTQNLEWDKELRLLLKS